MTATIPAQELTKLVGKASEAAAKAVDEGDAASEARAIDILKVLAGSQVTAPLLKETDAGKRINRLSKSSNEHVAAAASSVVQAWKACVKKQAADSGIQPSSSLPGVSSARSLSLPADNGSEQQEASTSQPAAATQPQRPAGTASAGKPPPRAGDSKRDKVRVLLVAGLALVPEDERGGQEPGDVAAEVETAIFQKFGSTGAEYGAKVRSIQFNLKDASNPDLRRRVMTGEIDPQELVNLSPEEMASDEKRQQNAKIRQEVAADLVRGQTQQASTDMFQCSRCKQKKCTYYQMQTRSADEPMTTFVTCVACNNKWKFC